MLYLHNTCFYTNTLQCFLLVRTLPRSLGVGENLPEKAMFTFVRAIFAQFSASILQRGSLVFVWVEIFLFATKRTLNDDEKLPEEKENGSKGECEHISKNFHANWECERMWSTWSQLIKLGSSLLLDVSNFLDGFMNIFPSIDTNVKTIQVVFFLATLPPKKYYFTREWSAAQFKFKFRGDLHHTWRDTSCSQRG